MRRITSYVRQYSHKLFSATVQAWVMDGDESGRAVARLRAAVLVGAVLGLLASSAVVGAVDVSVNTATVAVTNDADRTRTVTVEYERDGESVERTRDVPPGETVRPVALLDDGEYRVKVYADGQLCAHMTVEVAGANVLSSGTVTTEGNSLSPACETVVDTDSGPTVRA